MEVIQVQQTVEEDGRIVLTGLPVHRGENVEVTIRVRKSANERKPLTVGEMLASDLVGMWADRTDIEDSRGFARRLRAQAYRRPWSDDAGTPD